MLFPLTCLPGHISAPSFFPLSGSDTLSPISLISLLSLPSFSLSLFFIFIGF